MLMTIKVMHIILLNLPATRIIVKQIPFQVCFVLLSSFITSAFFEKTKSYFHSPGGVVSVVSQLNLTFHNISVIAEDIYFKFRSC